MADIAHGQRDLDVISFRLDEDTVPSEVGEGTDNEANRVDTDMLAAHVPQECFLLDFGGFGNFLWFQNLAQEHGGDIAQMIAHPGLDFQTGKRTGATSERQVQRPCQSGWRPIDW